VSGDAVAPVLLDAADEATPARLQQLHEAGMFVATLDRMAAIAEELFRIDYPFVAPGTPEYRPTLTRYLKRRWHGGDFRRVGVWAVFPWRCVAVHLPDREDFHRLRTARNRLLITDEEQQRARKCTIAVAGLSIGLSVVTALVLTGVGSALRLADFDSLDLSNLNRMSASVCELGEHKATIAAHRAAELDPFLRVETLPGGVADDNLARFLAGAQLLIDEMDDVGMKIRARMVARRYRVPVVMATDDGDNTIVDVERFDLEPYRPLFGGSVDEQQLVTLGPRPSIADRVRLGHAIVGAKIAPRMQESLQLVGSRLPSWPQLGTAATVSGASVAYVARRIVTGAAMPSGRYRVSLDASLDTTFVDPAIRADRARRTREFDLTMAALFGA
jgi:tRNA threonylcarbamoyladenosine dehydratase